MELGRRARGFTLIEAMIVVAIIGVLALLAVVAYRRWVHTAYLTEAQDMVSNIRAAEESFRAENGGYLSISNALGPGNDYPAATPGKFKTAWGAVCGVCTSQWSAINVQPGGPLMFGYSLIASNGQVGDPVLPSKTVGGTALNLTAMQGAPWYFIEADADTDGNGVFTNVYGMSGTNQLFVDKEGE